MLEIYIIRIISNIKFKKMIRKQLEILHMQQIFSLCNLTWRATDWAIP